MHWTNQAKHVSEILKGCIYLSITVITTTTGKVQGIIEPSSVVGKNIQKFVNIPYAEPPTGKLRFSKPVPKKQWDGKLTHVVNPFKHIYTRMLGVYIVQSHRYRRRRLRTHYSPLISSGGSLWGIQSGRSSSQMPK